MNSNTLVMWYLKNARNLPWRQTTDPYKIWISEVILQQTRVNQGIDYYFRFLERFPTVVHLATANEEDVLKMWQGLGYYSRARNILATAKRIFHEFNGVFPVSYEQILSLPGIGSYTAAAIVSICYKMPYPVIDGNVIRVITRIFGIEEEADAAPGSRKIEQALNEVFPKNTPDVFNQAIMEFGATFCTKTAPKCNECIFAPECVAFAKNLVNELPAKKPKKKPITEYYYYFYLSSPSYCIVNQRTDDGIWKNMYDFLLVQSLTEIEPDEAIDIFVKTQLNSNIELNFVPLRNIYKHQLSHKTIYARFIKVPLTDFQLKEQIDTGICIEIEKLKNLPVPKLIENFIASEV
ncbi:MAG TPA: A/G-specific adenine glycosylase [Bacteroidales bacterium]|nr:A/G-specific adenine glycosylase [Bacteroidales bacterium]